MGLRGHGAMEVESQLGNIAFIADGARVRGVLRSYGY